MATRPIEAVEKLNTPLAAEQVEQTVAAHKMIGLDCIQLAVKQILQAIHTL